MLRTLSAITKEQFFSYLSVFDKLRCKDIKYQSFFQKINREMNSLYDVKHIHLNVFFPFWMTRPLYEVPTF